MSQRLKVAVLPGDGIGPEVTTAALDVVRAALEGSGSSLEATVHPVGWAGVRAEGSPLPAGTLEAALAADAVFLGAVGDPEADRAPRELRPETGLLALRRELRCWANLRPARLPDALLDASALRPERARGTDVLIVRELGGGLYYGEPRGEAGGRAWNTLPYHEDEVRRLARMAFGFARARRGRVTSVDKANVLEVSRLWRRVVDEVAEEEGAGVETEHMLVDRAAMELVLHPGRFDVLLTENLFGDILSDQAGAIVGSLGALGSASLGDGPGLYEPVHGSAPEIAGKGIANPLGAILSGAMMLRHSFGLEAEAARIEGACDAVLAAGTRTADLRQPGREPVSTRDFAEAVTAALASSHPR